MKGHYDTILTALYERRNRLIRLDMDHRVNEPNVESLRSRINAVTDAINEMKARQKKDNLNKTLHTRAFGEEI